MTRLLALHRRLRRAVLARRRVLAALFAASAVAVGLRAASPTPPPRALVVTAARDLPGGLPVRAGDLATVAFDPADVPSGTLHSPAAALGRTTAGPVRAGEPLTDVRLVTGSILDGYPGAVAVPVRVGDPGAVALLRVGDRVDIVAADPQGGGARTVAEDVPVLAVPRVAPGAEPGMLSGGLVVVAASEEVGRRLAAAGVGSYLSVLINR